MAVVYVHSPVEVIIPSDNGVTVDIPLKAMVVPVPSGARGLPGYSPTVSTSAIEGGTEVTIHYEDGEVTFDVMNGEQGEQGEPGEPGEGIAPGGTTGQVLKKRSNADYDTEWANESGAVLSVNGKTGSVVLDADDVGALPDTYTPPVTSVNGQTGAVTVTVPTKTSELDNDSGFLTSAPVSSVNTKTGAVSLDADDVGAMPKWVLLWTNSSPSSNFSSQTVPLDLSGYDAVAILHHRTGSVNYDAYQYSLDILMKGYTGMLRNGGYAQIYRAVDVSATGCAFGQGKYAGTYNGSPSNDNSVGVPEKIYGIKCI